MSITHSERNADTVDFPPNSTPFPKVSTYDYLRQAANDLVNILKAPQQNIPTLTYGSPTTNAYIHLAQILMRATEKPQVNLPQIPSTQIASEPSVVTQIERKTVPEKMKAVPTPRVAKKTMKQHPIISNC